MQCGWVLHPRGLLKIQQWGFSRLALPCLHAVCVGADPGREGRGFGVLPWGWGTGPCVGAAGEEGRSWDLRWAQSMNLSCTLAIGEFVSCDQTQGFAFRDVRLDPSVH